MPVAILGSVVLASYSVAANELGRIRRGERPADDEVRHQWDEVTAEGRSRWDTLRARIEQRRRERAG